MEPRRCVQGASKVPLIFYFLSWVYESLLLLFNNLHVLSKKNKIKRHKLKKFACPLLKFTITTPLRQEAN